MNKHYALTILMAAGALAAGCGEDDDGGDGSRADRPRAQIVDLAERRAQLEKDPHGVRCSDIRDERSTRNTRMVQYALADEVRGTGMNDLQASQSIYFALTEICKSKPDSYEPAREAIAAVKSGKYRAEL